jgi:hypothetical protein
MLDCPKSGEPCYCEKECALQNAANEGKHSASFKYLKELAKQSTNISHEEIQNKLGKLEPSISDEIIRQRSE